jgi:hypothetical protein
MAADEKLTETSRHAMWRVLRQELYGIVAEFDLDGFGSRVVDTEALRAEFDEAITAYEEQASEEAP